MPISLKKTIRNLLNLTGYDIRRIQQKAFAAQYTEDQFFKTHGLSKIQYACGPKFLKDWINVDFYSPSAMKERYRIPEDYVYCQADLSLRQPFRNNSFSYGFAEDFIEHLSQADSLIFLYECYRVLQTGGVLRLSFPSLEGVLKRHFSPASIRELQQGRKDAFERFDHLHFYSREELVLVARHIGFSGICFTSFGQSEHDELKGLETREGQQDLNTYIELTR